MFERRKTVRRQADRNLQDRMQQLEEVAQGADTKERRHLRRQAIRHNCSLKVALKVRHSSVGEDLWSVDEHPIKGKLYDLSYDGALILTGNILDIGQELSLRITLRNQGEILIVAAVRWNRAVPEAKGYAAGVQFTQMPDADLKRIRAFLNEMEKNIGL